MGVLNSENSSESQQWFIRKQTGRKEIGPYRQAEVRDLISRKLLNHEDLLFSPGQTQRWTTVKDLESAFLQPTLPSGSGKAPEAFPDEALFILENNVLRGPVSVEQLKGLIKWDELPMSTIVCDKDGMRRTSLDEYFRNGVLPAQSANLPDPEEPVRHVSDRAKRKTDRRTRKFARPRNDRKSTPATAESESSQARDESDRSVPRAGTPSQKREEKRNKKKRRRESAGRESRSKTRSDEPLPFERVKARVETEQLPNDVDFLKNLKAVVNSERRSKRKKQRDEAREAWEAELSAEPSPKVSPENRAFMRFACSPAYERACYDWSMVFLVQSVAVLIATNAVMGIFLRKLGGLALSVFVPFGNEGVNLAQEQLLIVGVAAVCVGCMVVFPVWNLMRSDCNYLFCLGGTILGIILGLVMLPDFLPYLFMFVQGILVLGGILLGMTCFILLSKVRNAQIVTGLTLALSVTSVCVAGVGFCDMREIFELQLKSLPPTLQGSVPHAALFLGCSLVGTLAIPGVCYLILSRIVTPPVKAFMDSHLLIVGTSVAAMLSTTYCLISPNPDSFIGVTWALIPLAALNTVVALVPPVMWMTDPVSVGLHKETAY